MVKDKAQSSVYKPKFVKKTWGNEEWIVNNEKYCGKILNVKRDKFCSIHFHLIKREHFNIASGTIKMDLIHRDGTKESFIMNQGDTLEITPGLMHRFTAIDGDAVIIEFSTQHFDSDSYRVEKGSQ